jgi:hypothetical protein
METSVKAMINNTIKFAEHKLNQHRLQGASSTLNIFEVAQLMDTIKNADQAKYFKRHSIFHVGLN